ncbi:unnamed protein product [Rhodiola kirilowii]
MNRYGDVGHDSKRPRMQPGLWEEQQNLQPKFTENDKGKNVMKEEVLLVVRIIRAVDIDREFRPVTNQRLYGVLGWINPGEEYRSNPSLPNVLNYELDPVWDEEVMMPLGDTRVENATLHLEVIRASAATVDPGSSSGRRLVGQVEFRLDQLEVDRIVQLNLQLLQPVEFKWKLEGSICLEMQLLVIPCEEPGAF